MGKSSTSSTSSTRGFGMAKEDFMDQGAASGTTGVRTHDTLTTGAKPTFAPAPPTSAAAPTAVNSNFNQLLSNPNWTGQAANPTMFTSTSPVNQPMMPVNQPMMPNQMTTNFPMTMASSSTSLSAQCLSYPAQLCKLRCSICVGASAEATAADGRNCPTCSDCSQYSSCYAPPSIASTSSLPTNWWSNPVPTTNIGMVTPSVTMPVNLPQPINTPVYQTTTSIASMPIVAACYCDSSCTMHNDCCDDYKKMCTDSTDSDSNAAPTPVASDTSINSCKDRCRDVPDWKHQCYCDNNCVRSNDCCPDIHSVCPKTGR